MAKGETKTTNKMLDAEKAKTNTQFDQFSNVQGQRSNEAYDRSNDAYAQLSAGYGDMAKGNLLAGAGGAAPGSFGGGGYSLPSSMGGVKAGYQNFMDTGGIDANAARKGQGTMSELAGSGGYDPETRAALGKDIAKFREFGETGGVDDAARARMRGAGVFDEFAKTGGVSDADARNMRSRGNAPISAMYGGLSEEMNRARRISGGSSAGGAAMTAKMARGAAGAGADAARNTELGISDRVREGRQWGGSNIASSEGNLQGLITGNQLQGLQGASGTQMGMTNAIASNRLGGATALGQSEREIQGMMQSGKQFGIGGMQSVAGMEAAAAASRSSAGADDARFREGLRSEGLEGLSRLRGQAPGEVGMYDQNVLSGIGGRAGLSNDQINMRYNAQGNNTSGWDTALKVGGMAAGIAGGVMTGGASTAIGAGLKGMGGRPQVMPTPYGYG